MYKINLIKTLIAVFFVLGLFSRFSYAESYQLSDLLASPDSFDRKVITVDAEVVGEALKGESGVWGNIFSKGSNLGVFSKDPEAFRPITYWGSYKQTGDKVRVKGIFYKSCPQHQTSDIHLEDLKVLKKGHQNQMIVSSLRKRQAMVSFIIFLTITIIYLIRLKYGKRT